MNQKEKGRTGDGSVIRWKNTAEARRSGEDKMELESFAFLDFLFFIVSLSAVKASNRTADCGQQRFTSDHGGTVQFVRDSSSSKNCFYNIKVSEGRRIVLRWSTFKVAGNMPECKESSITVYTGCNPKKISAFCSENMNTLPHDIYSIDNCLSISFASTQGKVEEFSARYQTYPEKEPISTSTYCASQSYLYKKNGVIYSPRWPEGKISVYRNCDWKIKLPTDYVIKMNFMDVNLYKSSFYSCKSSSQRLKLEGEKSVLTSQENKEYYCGARTPFSKTTRYYQLELEYKARYVVGDYRGFIVGYVAYRTPETVTAAKNSSKLFYIGVAIAVIVLIGCCIFWAIRRRRRQAQAGGVTYRSAPAQEVSTTVMTQQKPAFYGSGPPPGAPMSAAPPPYSATVAQPPYQGYPTQQYAPAPYPSGPAPYPGAAAPYPPGGAPYPPGGAPYPSGGAPYPPTSASQTGYPTNESYSKASAPPNPSEAPPYPTGGPAR